MRKTLVLFLFIAQLQLAFGQSQSDKINLFNFTPNLGYTYSGAHQPFVGLSFFHVFRKNKREHVFSADASYGPVFRKNETRIPVSNYQIMLGLGSKHAEFFLPAIGLQARVFHGEGYELSPQLGITFLLIADLKYSYAIHTPGLPEVSRHQVNLTVRPIIIYNFLMKIHQNKYA